MTNDEKIEELTAIVSSLGEQMKVILDAINTRASYEESDSTVTVDGITMTLAEYDMYIRKLELDNRYRKAKKFEQLEKISEGDLNG